MRIDKSGHDRLAAEVDLFGMARSKPPHFVVAAHGEEAAIRDGDRLRARPAIVDGDDVSVEQNQIWLGPLQKECGRDGEGAHASKESAARKMGAGRIRQAHCVVEHKQGFRDSQFRIDEERGVTPQIVLKSC